MMPTNDFSGLIYVLLEPCSFCWGKKMSIQILIVYFKKIVFIQMCSINLHMLRDFISISDLVLFFLIANKTIMIFFFSH